jgi:hypothetical protein
MVRWIIAMAALLTAIRFVHEDGFPDAELTHGTN